MKKKMKFIGISILLVLCIVLSITVATKFTKNDYRTSAYINLTDAETVAGIKMENVTHAYIAFAYIGSDNKITLKSPAVKEEGKKEEQAEKVSTRIQMLREQHTDKKIAIAIGGYAAEGFSDMAMTKETRKVFVDSVEQFISDYKLDGVDIDWEFPVSGGNGTIKARPEDKENFTALMQDLRNMLDEKMKEENKKYELTFAQTASEQGFTNIELEKVEPLVDVINLMSYDYTGAWSKSTGFNSNLYKDKDGVNKMCTDDAIKKYEEMKFPMEKIVLGIPLYGYKWTGVPTNSNNGLYQEAQNQSESITYQDILGKCIDKNGFERGWNDELKVPYLYNENTFITYDDKESVEIKAEYIRKKKLGGAMFWEYSQDYNEQLIKTTSDILKRK